MDAYLTLVFALLFIYLSSITEEYTLSANQGR